jgi:hypothetical protein
LPGIINTPIPITITLKTLDGKLKASIAWWEPGFAGLMGSGSKSFYWKNPKVQPIEEISNFLLEVFGLKI